MERRWVNGPLERCQEPPLEGDRGSWEETLRQEGNPAPAAAAPPLLLLSISSLRGAD